MSSTPQVSSTTVSAVLVASLVVPAEAVVINVEFQEIADAKLLTRFDLLESELSHGIVISSISIQSLARIAQVFIQEQPLWNQKKSAENVMKVLCNAVLT